MQVIRIQSMQKSASHACVAIAVCPVSSRKNDDEKLALLLKKLESAFRGRKENEIFL